MHTQTLDSISIESFVPSNQNTNLPRSPEPRKPVVGSGDNHGCDPDLLNEDLTRHRVLLENGKFNSQYPGYLVQ